MLNDSTKNKDAPAKKIKFTQKKYATIHKYVFDEAKITFKYQHRRNKGEFSIAYAELPVQEHNLVEQNEWLLPISLLAVAACVSLLLASLTSSVNPINALPWAVFATGSYLWFLLSKTESSAWRTDQGIIYVLKDQQHDEICAQLLLRRKQQLLNWHGDIDLSNDLDQEIEKFKWLQRQNALSKQEMELKIAQVEKIKHQLAEGYSFDYKLN